MGSWVDGGIESGPGGEGRGKGNPWITFCHSGVCLTGAECFVSLPLSLLFISYLTLKGRKRASREREIMRITKIRLTLVMSKERSPVTKIGVYVRILSRGGFVC